MKLILTVPRHAFWPKFRKTVKEKRKHKTSVLPQCGRQRPKAFIFQSKGPWRPSWVQTGRIPQFKKIAGRGHILDSSETLKFDPKKPNSAVSSACYALWTLFFPKKPLGVTLWAWAAFSIWKRDPEGDPRDFERSNLLVTIFWPDCPSVKSFRTLWCLYLVLFSSIKQHKHQTLRRICRELFWVITTSQIHWGWEVIRPLDCLVRNIQLGCSNSLENNIFNPVEQFSARCDC